MNKKAIIFIPVMSIVIVGSYLFSYNFFKREDNIRTEYCNSELGINKDLIEYCNEDLGIKFVYPKKWGEITFEINAVGGVDGSGKKASGRFSNNPNLIFGARTKDFSEARGSGFTDFGMYRYEDEIEKYNPYKIISLADETKAAIFANQEISQIINPADRGARLYLKNSEFSGLAFLYRKIPSEDIDLFDKMISSIIFYP